MNLKSEWMKMSEDCFETISFGDLKVGQKFIPMIHPGDNHGHGGFKGAHYVFAKTKMSVDETHGIPYGIPTGQAMNIKHYIPSDFPDSMPVILLEMN